MGPLLFLSALTGFFFIDMSLFALTHKALISGVLCLYAQLLTRSSSSGALLITTAFVLSLESSAYYSSIYPTIACLIPTTLITLYFRRQCYNASWQPYGFLILYLLTQYVLIEPYLLNIHSSFSYTLMKIFANIIILALISLK